MVMKVETVTHAKGKTPLILFEEVAEGELADGRKFSVVRNVAGLDLQIRFDDRETITLKIEEALTEFLKSIKAKEKDNG